MEALSHGIPIIATNVGGTSEIVDNSVGALIDPNINNNIVIESIKRVLAKKEKILKNAYYKFNEMCDERKTYKEFLNYLDYL